MFFVHIFLSASVVLGSANFTRSENDAPSLDTNFSALGVKLIVAGGVPSLPRTRSFMALVGVGPENDKEWVCGGSIIAPEYVLCAAHCSNTKRGPAKWVRLGDLDISTVQDDARTQDREVVEVLNHPMYRSTENYYDIALYRLDKVADFNVWVEPLCLHSKPGFPEPVALLAGWGRTDFVGPKSDHLQEAELDIFSDEDCRRFHNYTNAKNPRGIDSDIMFCAGKIDGTKDSCLGDSGGPLVTRAQSYMDDCFYTQVGIVSYGEMCSLPESPGVYTRVSAFVPWIERVLQTGASLHTPEFLVM